MHATANQLRNPDPDLRRAKQQVKTSIQIFVLTFGLVCFLIAGTVSFFQPPVPESSPSREVSRTVSAAGDGQPVIVTGHPKMAPRASENKAQ